MNKERPDESEAKQFVQKVLGLQLEHADKNGGVDYRSRDGRHALEVSRVTDGRKRAGRDALGVSRETGTPAGELKTCWIAFAPDTQSGLKTFLQSVHPALVALESAGETLFEGQSAAARLIEKGRLSGIHLQLLEAGVERASAVPNHAHVSHSHRVFPVLSSGGTAGGSDDAVGLLTEELLKTGDNLKKLRASGAEHRHLFVWLDDDTRFDIARPLSREAPSWHDGFGLPSMSPALDPAITHLWVVHQGSGQGWLWDGETWQGLVYS